MHYTECENIPAILITIDFEKAFNCWDWSFLHLCLNKFGFPNTILKWVQALYSNIISCVSNNGFASSYFPVERGVRQGCPLSPYLFIIAVETLAIVVRENEKIKGIEIGNKEQKLSQYADDTSLTMHFAMNPSMQHLIFLMILEKVQVSKSTTTRQKLFVLVQWKAQIADYTQLRKFHGPMTQLEF